MAKLIKNTSSDTTAPSEMKQSRIKTIIDRKDKAKNTDNQLLTSVPLSMQSTMQFINERNQKAKESPNYGKISENKISNENNLSDHDMFKNFFQR